MERGRIQGLPNFFGYPLLSQEREKLRISNLARIFRGFIRTKIENPIENFGEKGAWTYAGTAQFFRVPPIISGTAKAAIFKFCTHIYRLDRNKRPLKFSGKVAMGIVRDSQNFSGHPYICMAHRAVIFATAQLSCNYCNNFVYFQSTFIFCVYIIHYIGNLHLCRL